MSKIFVDFEYTREHQFTTAISFGVVTEDGKNQFYAELTDYDQNQVDEWLMENVFNLLIMGDEKPMFSSVKDNLVMLKGDSEFIVNSKNGLNNWLMKYTDDSTVFSSFGIEYDFILFKQLYNKCGMEIPNFLKNFGFCVSTMLQIHGYDPNMYGIKESFADVEGDGKHNALFDAKVARKIYLKISEY